MPLSVAHSAVAPGRSLAELAGDLRGTDWDMVELDVLADGNRLMVAHDPGDLALAPRIEFGEAVSALLDLFGDSIRFDVDVKATGYEQRVAEAIDAAGITERTLASTMQASSLAVLRQVAPRLSLGLSVPLARRNYLAHPLTRPGAYAMLAYLRRVLPGQVARALDAGEADAIMAHWGTVTERLVSAVVGRGAELFVWTVDDPAQVGRLRELGVSGIITNDRRMLATV